MEEIGVMAVVKELSKFTSDMGKVDSAIAGIVPTSGLLGSALSGLNDIAHSVGSFIANTLAVAIGNLLADAVEWASQKLQELVTSAIDAGNEFQALEIRLNQMNFNTALESTDDYTTAMGIATEQTKEQLLWVQKLATVTPFELEDITKVYSMARSYGFADEEARDLTETLADFTSGMGLTGDAAISVVRQFGQMKNTGKILQKDLNALAEGGMVPVNKILDIMKEKTGLTGAEFDNFKTSADGATMFLATFTDYVKNNYTGAAENANRTLKNATITLKEFFSSFAASEVVKPIMDLIGGSIADLNDQLQARLPEIIGSFGRIGESLVDIVGKVMGLGPSSGEMADIFVDGLDGIADWLTTHADDIVNFFKDAKDFVVDVLIPSLKDLKDWLFGENFRMKEGKEGFLEKMFKTLENVKPLVEPIKELFKAILEVGAAVFNIDISELGDKTFAENVKLVADEISKLAKFLSDNAEIIGALIRWFFIFQISLGIVAGVISTVIGFVISAVTAFVGWWSIITTLGTVFAWLGGVIAAIAGAITAPMLAIAALVAAIVILGLAIYNNWDTIKAWAVDTGNLISTWAFDTWMSFMQWTADTTAAIDEWYASSTETFKLWIDETIAGIGEWATTTGDSIKEWAQNTWDSFIAWGTNLIDSVTTTWNQLGFLIGYYAGQIWETIKTWVSDTWNSIAEWGSNLWNSISTTWNQLWVLVEYYTGQMWASIRDWVENTRQSIMGFGSGLWDSINETFNDILNIIREKIDHIRNIISDKFGDIRNILADISWYDVGVDMMQGMINGIGDMMGNLADAAWNAARAAYEAALEALEIGSPSKLFIGIGTNTVQGLIDGIDNAASGAAKAMQGVVSGVVSVGASAPTMASSAAPSYVSNTTNNNNYNLNINSSARTEPILQDFNLMQSLQSR